MKSGLPETTALKIRPSKRSHPGEDKLDGPNEFWNEVEWNCVLEDL